MEREEEQILLELARRERDEAIRYYIPHGGQIEFIKLIEGPGAFIVISGAGNGWGKSDILAAVFAAVMWPQMAPPAFSGPTFTDWKYPKRARIYSSPAELEDIGSLQTAIKRLFPKDRYEVSNGKYRYPSVFRTDTGWVLDMFSYERAASEAAGPNIGLQAINEPPPEALWKEILARSRAGGLILGGLTSLTSEPWVVDGILNRHNGKDIRVRYGNSCENCKQHGVNGNLEHTRIEQLLAQYDPDEREARFSGKPLSMSGRIFKTFDRNVHVAKQDIPVPAEPWTHYQAVDPAIGKPLAVIWAYVDVTGLVTIYREWPDYAFEGTKDPNLTVKEYVELFKGIEQGQKIETRIIDRHFGNARRTLGGLTLRQEFNQAGLDFIDSYTMEPATEVETGIAKVRDFLRYDPAKPLDGLNRPRLLISPNCKNTIAAFERWGRNPETRKPQEQYKDFADVVRYLVMANPVHDISRPWGTGSPAHYGVS